MLETLKLLVGIEPEETDLDTKLEELLSMAKQRLKVLLRGVDPPEELEYIIIDVAAARFNRLGSEGLKGHSVEGESFTFNENDFDGFEKDIKEWHIAHRTAVKGKVRFI